MKINVFIMQRKKRQHAICCTVDVRYVLVSGKLGIPIYARDFRHVDFRSSAAWCNIVQSVVQSL